MSRYSKAIYGLTVIIAAIASVGSVIASFDREGYPLFHDPTALSPLSRMWFHVSQSPQTVTASSSVPSIGEDLTLDIPTKFQSIGGHWRATGLHLLLDLSQQQKAKGFPSEINIVEVLNNDWNDQIVTQGTPSQAVVVTIKVQIPQSNDFVDQNIRGTLSGKLEMPRAAGADTVLGGAVQTNSYFKNYSEDLQSAPVDVFVFSPREKNWWRSLRIITGVMLFTFPLMIVIALKRLNTGEDRKYGIDVLTSSGLLVLVLMVLLMAAFFLGRQRSSLLILIFSGLFALISFLVSLGKKS